MRTTTLLLLALSGGAALTLARPAAAQRSAEDWLANCREQHGWRDRVHYCEVREMGLRSTGGTIAVDGRENGGVAVRGWDRDSIGIEVRIEATAESDDDARAIARQITVATTGGPIRAEGPDGGGRHTSWAVSYEISVPRRSDLRVDTHNGPIVVRGVNGRMALNAENGPLVLDAVAGDVHGRTTNGPLEVRLAGARWDGAGLDAETTNGPVRLAVPRGYSARLETGTTNGPMSIGFPITVQGHLGREIDTVLGSGGPTVRAITTNGPLVIDER